MLLQVVKVGSCCRVAVVNFFANFFRVFVKLQLSGGTTLTRTTLVSYRFSLIYPCNISPKVMIGIKRVPITIK